MAANTNISVREAAEFLLSRDSFLILTHVRPDGDTIGCACGLCRALRLRGKEAHILRNPQTTDVFLPYLEGLIAPEDYVPRTVVCVDIAARNMLPENAQVYGPSVDLTVDHHPTQEFYAARTCVDPGRAACAEIVYKIVKEMGPVTPEIALPLYMGLATDTGCFVYSNTDASAHETAAELIRTGIDVYPVNRRHFRSKSLLRLRLESMLTESMEIRDGGRTGIVCLTLKMMEDLGAREDDIEDVSAFVGQIEGIQTGVTLRELKPGVCKLSLRTDPGDLNASKVCGLLGGGGHAAASGATMEGVTMAEARQKVLDAIETVRAASAV